MRSGENNASTAEGDWQQQHTHTHRHFQINGFSDVLHKKITVWMLALRWTEINRLY